MGLKLSAKIKQDKDGLFIVSIPSIDAVEVMSNFSQALDWIQDIGIEKFKDEFMKKNGKEIKNIRVQQTSFSVSVGLFLEVTDQSTLEDDYTVTIKAGDNEPVTMKGSTFERTPEILAKAQKISDQTGEPIEDIIKRGVDQIVKDRKKSPQK